MTISHPVSVALHNKPQPLKYWNRWWCPSAMNSQIIPQSITISVLAKASDFLNDWISNSVERCLLTGGRCQDETVNISFGPFLLEAPSALPHLSKVSLTDSVHHYASGCNIITYNQYVANVQGNLLGFNPGPVKDVDRRSASADDHFLCRKCCGRIKEPMAVVI